MKINDKTNINGFESVKDAQKKSELKNQADRSTKASSDKISISDSAKETSTLIKSVKNSPDVREDKVNEMKMKIDSGAYDVSGKMVAEKIVGSAISDTF